MRPKRPMAAPLSQDSSTCVRNSVGQIPASFIE